MATFLLSGCASNAPFDNSKNGVCTPEQSQLVTDHIGAQISAFQDQDFEKAYSYAAVSFQKDIDLDSFTQSIEARYFMLIENDGVDFGQCEIITGDVLQIVIVKSSKNNFALNYVLSLEDGKLGVVAAVVTSASENTIT